MIGWLAHPATRGVDLDDPRLVALRRQIVRDKAFLRRIYEEWYAAAGLPAGAGAVLELGSGGGFLDESVPELITSELQPTPHVRVVLDGQMLPLAAGSLRAIVMTDVLHHLPESRRFLRESARCVRPGGRLLMIEPWVSPWSTLIYTRLHHEPFRPDADEWEFPRGGPLSAANMALPWIMFVRDRALRARVPAVADRLAPSDHAVPISGVRRRVDAIADAGLDLRGVAGGGAGADAVGGAARNVRAHRARADGRGGGVMKVWGARVRPPNLNRALAAFLLNAGLMGREERRFFERTVTPGQRVVDVGANQGIFTLLLSRLVGPDGRVVSLEPEPDLFAALDENCRVNGAANVTRLRAAAGRERSEGVLHCSRFNSGDNRLSASLEGPAVPVSILPLDEILTDGAVDLVKIDVQGYELNVVTGMQAVIERSPAIRIFFEFWPAGLGYAGCAPDQLLDFFVVRRFSLYELAGGALRQVDAGDVVRSTKAGDWSWRNFLAVRE